MDRRSFIFSTIGLSVAALPRLAAAAKAELFVLSSGGFTPAFRSLAPGFHAHTGDTTELVLGASMGDTPTAIPTRLKRGKPADVLLMVGYALDKAIADGLAVKGSRVDLARSDIGMAVKAGAPKPDISTVEALKRTLLDAKSIAYSDSASGVYLANTLFPKLGIMDQIKGKLQMIPGDPVAGVVARGGAEIGFQQISELKPIPGAEVVGAIPAEVQSVTVYAAGIASASKHKTEAKRLIQYLASPQAAAAVRATGMRTMG